MGIHGWKELSCLWLYLSSFFCYGIGEAFQRLLLASILWSTPFHTQLLSLRDAIEKKERLLRRIQIYKTNNFLFLLFQMLVRLCNASFWTTGRNYLSFCNGLTFP